MKPPLLPVILFDGECSLCNYSTQFILRRDPNRRFHFAALQSPAAQNLLRQAGQEPTLLPDSVILVEPGRVTTKSTAALRIARHLSGLWRCRRLSPCSRVLARHRVRFCCAASVSAVRQNQRLYAAHCGNKKPIFKRMNASGPSDSKMSDAV